MSIRFRLVLYLLLITSIILIAVLLIIVSSATRYRQEEFQDRLIEKGETSLKLLMDVKEIDSELLRKIDENTIHKMYNEKVLIFDENRNIIYKSIDDAVIAWDDQIVNQIERNGFYYFKQKEYDIVGIKRIYYGKEFIILISAEDKFGNNKIENLQYTSMAAFFVGILLIGIFSFWVSYLSLKPLNEFKEKISLISEKNLNLRIEIHDLPKELKDFAQSFNKLLEKIDWYVQYQKSFISQASHELRTPISKMILQIDNILISQYMTPEMKIKLKSILEDANQLSDIVNSLNLLTKDNSEFKNNILQKIRLDELIFDEFHGLKELYPDVLLNFEIETNQSDELDLEISGDFSMLKIVIRNLLKNAYIYSFSKKIITKIQFRQGELELIIENDGNVLTSEEQQSIFKPFIRGKNSNQQHGMGLGLSIIKRILDFHGYSIRYEAVNQETNRFVLNFQNQTSV